MSRWLRAQLRSVTLAGGLVASVGASAAETFEYIHTDALGSPVAVTNANGVVIERTAYEPYGAVVGGQVKDGPGYTGHVSDSATGLSYMQQRYYDPGLGIFVSADPVASSVESFARYAYVGNSPYRFVDPDGRQKREIREATTGSKIKGAGPAAGSRLVVLGGNRGSNFTLENAQERLDTMSAIVSATKDKMESIPNATSDDAAKLFRRVYQKYSEKYGWEVFAEIVRRSGGPFHLSDIGISPSVTPDGIGGFAGMPLYRGINIHTHPLLDGWSTSYSPFSYGDLQTYKVSQSVNYLSDPSGLYILNEKNEPELVK